MHVIVCIFVCEFRNEIILSGEECKTWVNLNFSKKKWGKNSELAAVIQVENFEVF